MRARDFGKALQLLQPALQQSPKSAQLWTLQGIAFSGKNQEKEALASFRNALKISPDYLPALEGAAQLEYRAGSDAAIPLLQHVLKLRPGDPTSHAMLAVLFAKRRDCDSAVQHFEQSGAAAGFSTRCAAAVRHLPGTAQELEKAISVFGRLLALDPASRETRHYLATVQLMAEHPNDAIETLDHCCKQAIRIRRRCNWRRRPMKPVAIRRKPSVCCARRLFPIPAMSLSISTSPSISMDHQSFPAGIAMINSGLSLQPNAAELYLARGVLYVQMAQYDQAEADFDKANALDPEQSNRFCRSGIGSGSEELTR